MTYKAIFSIIILTIFSIISFYISGITGVLNFLVTIGCYTIIFYCFHIVYNTLRKKGITDSLEYMKNFAFKISIFMLVTISILGGSAYISNEIYPAKMPEYTISNGEKTIVFQAMVHIGNKSFYEQIVENIKAFKNDGGVYFFEGVRPGNKENGEKLNQALGAEFDEEFYQNFSKLYGVSYQDNSKFLGLVNNKDFNIDLSVDDIIKLYEEKIEINGSSQETQTPVNINEDIIKSLSSLNDKELAILVYVNQAILNILISSDDLQSGITENFGNKELFDVILEERNKVLANAIISSEYDNIYVTYGLLHFKGVFDLLKENDSNWEITNINYLYPIH